jgi:hypothetical protein
MALLQKLITILDMLEKNIENLNAHKKYIMHVEGSSHLSPNRSIGEARKIMSSRIF